MPSLAALYSSSFARSARRSSLLLALSLVGAVIALPSTAQDTAAAQDPAAVERGFAVWKGQDCTGCHGWAGNGERIGENPTGPSLRAIEFPGDVIKEVVLCGRPSSDMPAHDPQAYTDDRCYGMTKADIAGQRLLKGKPMTADEANDLVAYLLDRVVGRPNQPNQDDCLAYYGEKKKRLCERYPTAESQGL